VWTERSEVPLARLHEVEVRSNPSRLFSMSGGTEHQHPRNPPSLAAE